MKKRKSKGDVEWVAPGKRRPFAYSTMAESHFLGLMAEAG